MLSKTEAEMMIEEHGLGNIIIESNYIDRKAIIKVIHDGAVIENPEWYIMTSVSWLYDLERRKEVFDLDNSEWLCNLNDGIIPDKIENQGRRHMGESEC